MNNERDRAPTGVQQATVETWKTTLQMTKNGFVIDYSNRLSVHPRNDGTYPNCEVV